MNCISCNKPFNVVHSKAIPKKVTTVKGVDHYHHTDKTLYYCSKCKLHFWGDTEHDQDCLLPKV